MRSVQHGLHRKMPDTQMGLDGNSAGQGVSTQQQSPVDSMDEPYAKRRRVDGGQSPVGPGVEQQQDQQTAWYTAHQPKYQHETQADWRGSTKQTAAFISQPRQSAYGDSPTYGAYSHSNHAYAHKHGTAQEPTRSSSTYPSPIHTVSPQWISGDNTQGQERCYHSSKSTARAQPVQIPAYQQSLHGSATHTIRAYQGLTPAHTLRSGSELYLQSTHPTAPGHISLQHIRPSGNAPLRTRLLPSSTIHNSFAGGSAPLSAVAPVLSEPTIPWDIDDLIGRPSEPPATEDVLSFFNRNGSIAWDSVVRAEHSQPEGSLAISKGAPLHSNYFEEPVSTPLYNQSPLSMVIPGGHLFPSAPLWPTPAGLSSVEGPSSHSPQRLVQANMAASGQTPNSDAGQNGSAINIDVDIVQVNGIPRSFGRQIDPDRRDRTHTRPESKPYQLPIPSVIRKSRPVQYEDNLGRLQQRCRKQGADEGAIGFLGKVFANEVSQRALMRPLTDAEVETMELGIVMGMVYTAFLEPTDEGEDVSSRYICRLCHRDRTWKHSKDVVRHLKRDHFGLADTCKEWYVFHQLLTLASINPWNAASESSILKAR